MQQFIKKNAVRIIIFCILLMILLIGLHSYTPRWINEINLWLDKPVLTSTMNDFVAIGVILILFKAALPKK